MDGWNPATLHAHFSAILARVDAEVARQLEDMRRLIDVAQQSLDLRFKEVKEAVALARENIQLRLETLNELRDLVQDFKRDLITRAEVEARLASMDERVAELKERLDRTRGESTGLSKGWGWLVGLIGIVIAILSFWLRTG